jgi:hypothetical protein
MISEPSTRSSARSNGMSIRSFSLVDTIIKLVKGERSDHRYEEIFSEKKIEQLYHFWDHL